MQVEYGLLCDSDGRPVGIEAFEGSLKDDKTLPSQVKKLEQRFGLTRVIVVTDRGIGTKDNVTLLSDLDQWVVAGTAGWGGFGGVVVVGP